MALKPILKSLDGLSDEVKKLYVQKDGEYQLDIEGGIAAPAKVTELEGKLTEFRDNNRNLNAKVTELTESLKQFDGVDVTKYKEYEATQQKLKDKQLIEAGKIDELLNSKIEPIKASFESNLKAAQNENRQLLGQLEMLQIDNQLTELGTKKGIQPTAIADMLARGRRIFHLQNGKVVALDHDGAQVRTKSGDPLTMPVWLDLLSTEAPHLFQPSNGGGAGGGKGGDGAKTLRRDEFQKLDPAAQMKFVKTDGGKIID